MTPATTDQRIRHHATAVCHATYKFVTEHQRRFTARTVTKEARDIGAANSREIDRQFYFPIAWRGTRAFFHFQPIGCRVDQRSHKGRIVHVVHEQSDEILIFRLAKANLETSNSVLVLRELLFQPRPMWCGVQWLPHLRLPGELARSAVDVFSEDGGKICRIAKTAAFRDFGDVEPRIEKHSFC
jgi:hypothetical protein